MAANCIKIIMRQPMSDTIEKEFDDEQRKSTGKAQRAVEVLL